MSYLQTQSVNVKQISTTFREVSIEMKGKKKRERDRQKGKLPPSFGVV